MINEVFDRLFSFNELDVAGSNILRVKVLDKRERERKKRRGGREKATGTKIRKRVSAKKTVIKVFKYYLKTGLPWFQSIQGAVRFFD